MLVVSAVDDHHAVEMVELVLDDARTVGVELIANALAVRILALEHDGRRALDRHPNALQREAALVLDEGLLAALDDHRVDDRARAVLVGLEHEQASKNTDLRGC